MATDHPPAVTEPARVFVCGIATGTEAGYPDEVCDALLRRIKSFVDVPGLQVLRTKLGSLEVYCDDTISAEKHGCVESIVWGFGAGFKIGAEKNVAINITRKQDGWHASVDGRSDIWAAHRTSYAAAVGGIVISHPELLNTSVKVNVDPALLRYLTLGE